MNDPESIPTSVKAQFDLTGRIAVITGGAGYLGVRFAEAIAEMGGLPVLFDNHAEGLAEAARRVRTEVDGASCESETVDVSDLDGVRSAVDRVAARHGRIDVLVNSAALTKSAIEGESGALGASLAASFFAPFEDYRREIWDMGLAVNLTGTMFMCQAVGRCMVRQGKGSIINIASDVAVVAPDHRIYDPDPCLDYKGSPFNAPPFYAPSKAAVVQLTRYLATYWAKQGIRVNAVSPAGVFRNHDPGFVRKYGSTIPLGRMARDHEFKGAIAFLASDASSFVTGTNLMVDGGRTCW